MECEPRTYPHSIEGQSLSALNGPLKRVLIIGGGYNTRHMYENGGLDDVDADVAEVKKPLVPVPPERLHYVDTPEGHAKLAQLVEQGTFHSVYGSVIPRLHLDFIETYIKEVAKGRVDLVVVSKPAVETLEEMFAVDRMLKAAMDAVQKSLGDAYDPEKNPLLLVHEHYVMKASWRTLIQHLPAATERLGRLAAVTINIEEDGTDDDRVLALQGGILQDLMPHAASMGLDIWNAVNTTGRYTIPNRTHSEVRRTRHEGSELRPGIETGFIVRKTATIIDHKDGNTKHALPLTLRGGKGGVERKDAMLEFVDDKGTHTLIRADLRKNILDIPESARDLFEATHFTDNGYGESLRDGLVGDTPQAELQAWEDARRAIKTQHHLGKLGLRHAPFEHAKGVALEVLEPAVFGGV